MRPNLSYHGVEYGVQIRSPERSTGGRIANCYTYGKVASYGLKTQPGRDQTNGRQVDIKTQRTRTNQIYEGKGLTFVVTRIIEKQEKGETG